MPARVLVADDNADMREYLARLLRTAGYQVTTVTDGQAALDAVRVGPPDLVISDVMMPRLDGLGLVAALRADARTAAVPVLLLSARAGQEASIEGLRAGADDYLVKPFSAVELLARVRSNLEMARFRNRESQFRRTLIDSLQEGFFVTDRGRHHPGGQSGLPGPGGLRPGRPAVSGGRTPGFRTPAPTLTGGRRWPRRSPTTSATAAAGTRSRPGTATGTPSGWPAARPACPSPDGRGRLFVGTARDVTAERLAGQREATLAGFAAALAAAGEISEMLTTAAREIAAAVHASQVTTALWSSDGNPAITGWPRPARGQGASAAVTEALDAVRHQPAASVAVLPGDEGASLLAAPLDGTGSSAIAAEFPAGSARQRRGAGTVLGPHQPPGPGPGQGAGTTSRPAPSRSPSSTPSSPRPSCRTDSPRGTPRRFPRSKSAATGTT